MTVQSERRLTGYVARGRQVWIVVDGAEMVAYEGESIAAALLAAGRRDLRSTPRRGEPRGMYCGIGLCFECVLTVDGQRGVRGCQTRVCDGMRVETGSDTGDGAR